MIISGKKYLTTWIFPQTYSKKYTSFLKKYNNAHKNLQVTYKIFEKIYLHFPEIIITRTNLQEKFNIVTMLKLGNKSYEKT